MSTCPLPDSIFLGVFWNFSVFSRFSESLYLSTFYRGLAQSWWLDVMSVGRMMYDGDNRRYPYHTRDWNTWPQCALHCMAHGPARPIPLQLLGSARDSVRRVLNAFSSICEPLFSCIIFYNVYSYIWILTLSLLRRDSFAAGLWIELFCQLYEAL
jgi:hypothetical protein